MFVMGVSRVSRASKDSPLFSFMQLRFSFSFKTVVQLSRSLLFFKTARATLSFITFSGCRGMLSCLNFSWAPLTLHPPLALEKHGCLGAQVPHLYMPVSGTISFRFIVLYLICSFSFLACNVSYTISFRTNPLALGTLAAATASTGALGYTEPHLVRPKQALSRSLIPKTCSILVT